MAASPIRVFLVDDYPLFLEALARFLQDDPAMAVVGTASQRSNLAQALDDAQPDVVVIDPAWHQAELPQLVRGWRARWPQLGVVFLMLENGRGSQQAALEAGADAFVSKDQAVEELLGAIRCVAHRA